MRWIRILACCVAATCLIGIVACGGCAHMAVNKALQQYKEQLDPSIGRMTKDDDIKEWGPPASTTAVSDGEEGGVPEGWGWYASLPF